MKCNLTGKLPFNNIPLTKKRENSIFDPKSQGMNPEKGLSKILSDFRSKRILIIGDVMVDEYLWVKVTRISPEAPVPIVSCRKREYRMGGAANVAVNIKGLEAKPVLCSVIGDDEKGRTFIGLMKLILPINGICLILWSKSKNCWIIRN